KIGLMAGLPVLGEKFNPMTRQSSEPWVLASELKREFEVKEVSMGAKEIDKDINVLLLIHPHLGSPPQPSSSSLPTLFKAWGVEMDAGKVPSDAVFGSGGGARYTPTVLSLNR